MSIYDCASALSSAQVLVLHTLLILIISVIWGEGLWVRPAFAVGSNNKTTLSIVVGTLMTWWLQIKILPELHSSWSVKICSSSL